MSASNLVVSKLCYSQDDKTIIHNLSFEVAPGELLHICGQNGSGKSTLLRILVGVLEADHGQISLPNGAPFDNLIAYLGHKDGLTPQLNALAHFSFDLSIACKLNQSQIIWLLDQWGVPKCHIHKPVGQLSAGQRKRVAFALLQSKNAKIWLLDEPLFNLDVDGQKFVLDMIKLHISNGGIVILTQHQPPESGFVLTLEEHKYVASVL